MWICKQAEYKLQLQGSKNFHLSEQKENKVFFNETWTQGFATFSIKHKAKESQKLVNIMHIYGIYFIMLIP